VDANPQVSTITNAATGEITTLMHMQKTYMLIPAATSKAMMAQMTKMLGAAAAATPAAPKASGKTDKINGYTATEYTFDNGIMKGSYWMSTDFPNAQAVSDALAQFRKGSLADMTKAFAPDISKLPGVPIKTDVEFSGQKVTTEIVSATIGAVDPTQFTVPAGYTETKMPAMPMMQQ
jgi:hypothetical protein